MPDCTLTSVSCNNGICSIDNNELLCDTGVRGEIGPVGDSGVCGMACTDIENAATALKHYNQLRSSIPNSVINKYEMTKTQGCRCVNACKALESALISLQEYNININYEDIIIEIKRYKTLSYQYESIVKSIEIDYPHIRYFGHDYFPSRYYPDHWKDRLSLTLSALSN